jgi:hypothetical protein
MIQGLTAKTTNRPQGAYPLGADLPIKKGGNMKMEIAKLNPTKI